MTFTGNERVEIAKKEYQNWGLKKVVVLDNGKTIGYVSQVNDKSTGEQSFVITDQYVPPTASLNERQAVTEVTVLYRGSTAPDKGNLFDSSNPTYQDVRSDWLGNDIPAAMQIMNGGESAIPQLKSASTTLQETMKAYPNALVDIYGHSLGSMNGQYAVSDLPEVFHTRISGVYIYQGPNIYSILNEQQQTTADKLTDAGKIFNFIDTKDLIPIGYSSSKKQVGTLIEVESKKVDMVTQHMWGGYQFDKAGNIISRSKGNVQLAQHEANKEIERLTTLRKKMIQVNGGLSSAQEIFIDAMQAKAITTGYKHIIQTEIDGLTKWLKKEIENAHELWQHTKADAQRWGQHLSETEKITALAEGNVTEFSTVHQPVNEYETILTMLRNIQAELDQLLAQIKATIDQQVATDSELANYFS